MTRLADALARANRIPDDLAAVRKPTPARVDPHAVASTPRDLVNLAVRDELPIAARAVEPAPPFHGRSLLSMPKSKDLVTAWRTDPDLVGKLFGTEGFSGAALEQYRKLAATLHHAQSEHGIKVVMVGSAAPAEGKSLTSINLALSFAESYHRRVLLIDADLRRPTVQRIFGVPLISGLNDGLKASEDRPMKVAQVAERLFVLPAGRPEPDPMSGLTSDRMRRLIAEASKEFDWVFIDTPPVGLLPDATLLASQVDGVLLVVRAGKTPFALVKRAVEAITRDRILGVVMNQIDVSHDRSAVSYHEYYGAGHDGISST
jgi:capsular exopolysaccharide synthesis family protein